MANERYTEEHEWVRIEGNVAVCGISDYAQEQLGDVVFVELPEIGRVVSAKDEIAVVESVKAASDIYAPVSGEVVAVNSAVEDDPETVNRDALGKGWLFKIKLADSGEADSLMDESSYEDFIAGLED
ncbi:MAG: glycine cleavage system protein GcvH [Alphaproteobacteria bacterium]|nr:glycine cleavage system protein GcvH [Alphaproteobacteria bacterium]MCB9927832.1 glycine cleavage system protein GcvH [Alphaproteobacteria bacterium]